MTTTDGDLEPIPLSGDMQVLSRVRDAASELGWQLLAYTAALVATALGLAAALFEAGVRAGDIWSVLALAVIAAYAQRTKINLGGTYTVSISLLPAIFACALFGPLAGMIVYAPSAFSFPYPWVGRVSYFGSRAGTGAIAGGAALLVQNLMPSGLGSVVVGAAVAATVAIVADASFVAITNVFRGHGGYIECVRYGLSVTGPSALFYSPAVAFLVLAYKDISPWTIPLFFAPALAAQRWFLMYQEQRRLVAELGGVNEQLRAANLSFAKGLIATLDARDQYTAGHSAAVAIYARDIARRMGLSVELCDLAHLCGLVHDIGKIGLPAGLLEKPGALTLDERREMQRHSEIGERILANVDSYAEIAAVVRHHHERVDGQGYPDGLQAEEIPLLARIIAVADAYNAMTSDRPYRDAMPSRVARLRLAQAVETQFDTAVVAAFEAILAGATEDYRLGRRDDFEFGRDLEDSRSMRSALSA
ncbi:MAG TPA: HD-GYP domain-containing protein [Gaiellaceae bacterium]|nr:HD-GYP domain-containing protein [Gaiellaceae bacterium]